MLSMPTIIPARMEGFFFLTTWGRFEQRFKRLIDDLNYHADFIYKEAVALNIAKIQSLLKERKTNRAEDLDAREREEKAEIERKFQAIVAHLQIHDSDQITLWESLNETLSNEGTCSLEFQGKGR